MAKRRVGGRKAAETPEIDSKALEKLARERFGYEALRPGQEQVIRLVLEGHDTLSVMPTGSGKSAIYQMLGLLLEGPTVIVSPLIALQKDQLESIREQDLAPAAVVNSTIRVGEKRDAFYRLESGDLEYLFLAPEQFGNAETMEHLRERPPSLFVVDEAHCISEWGHDFRPDYCRIGGVIDELSGARGGARPRVLALTATASPNVGDDIMKRLGMRNARKVVWGFDRPNIWLGVETCPDEQTKLRVLIARVKDAEKPGIVYVATHAHAEEVTKALAEAGIKAGFYHGGMKKDERNEAQDKFMGDELDVVVATNAFGMGVDKADVRFVFHYDISESIDAYYQEVGRAGRDGKPARAILLYRPEDVGMRRAMAAGGKLTEGQVEQVAELLSDRNDPVSIKELKEEADLAPGKVAAAVNRLAEVGAVDVKPGGEVVVEGKIDVAAAAEEAVKEQEAYREYRRGRVELMKDYAETKDCRRRYILNYFGEQTNGACGHCDNCDTGVALKQAVEDSKLPFALKSRVIHSKWGEGVVMRYEEDKVVVQFDTEGAKSLVTDFVIKNRLLEPAG